MKSKSSVLERSISRPSKSKSRCFALLSWQTNFFDGTSLPFFHSQTRALAGLESHLYLQSDVDKRKHWTIPHINYLTWIMHLKLCNHSGFGMGYRSPPKSSPQQLRGRVRNAWRCNTVRPCKKKTISWIFMAVNLESTANNFSKPVNKTVDKIARINARNFGKSSVFPREDI